VHNGDDPKNFHCVSSPYQELARANAAAGGATTFLAGCDLTDPSEAGFAAAVAAAEAADAVVIGLGISERFGTDTMEHETHDRQSIDLPDVQKQLAKQLLAAGKPTVLFLLNGGMVALDDLVVPLAERSAARRQAAGSGGTAAAAAAGPAIIEAFYPGMEGGKALAQSIFGQANKWGRM
jgi:hypothetical protein